MLMTPQDRDDYKTLKERWHALASWFAADAARVSDEVALLADRWARVDRGIATDPSHIPAALADVVAAEMHAAFNGFPMPLPYPVSVTEVVSIAGPGSATPSSSGPGGDRPSNPNAAVEAAAPYFGGGFTGRDPAAGYADPPAGEVAPAHVDVSGADAVRALADVDPTKAVDEAVATAVKRAHELTSTACHAVWDNAGPVLGDWACENNPIALGDVPLWVWGLGAGAVVTLGLLGYAAYRTTKFAAPYAVPLALGAYAPGALPAYSRAYGRYAPGTLPEGM